MPIDLVVHARRWAVALMVASGFAGLGYQIVWTQQSALWLGHETAAVLAVVTALFGGLAIGALVFGARVDASERPARWYAACEAVIGLWSVALIFLMAPVSGWLLDLIGAQPAPAWHWAVAFVGTFLLLLPTTAAMGATLPAMERILGSMRTSTSISILYAGNTFGAVIGVLATAFVLVPRFGLSVTAAICVATSFSCAVVALKTFSPRVVPETVGLNKALPHEPLLAATGLLGLGYEVLVVRVLSQVAENTVYTFAILLAVYLVGTALGAAAYSRAAAKPFDPERLRDRLLRALAAACLLGVVSLTGAATIKEALLGMAGPGMTAALGVEALLAVTAFLLPTIMMGALFSHLASVARTAGVSFGRAIGVNTLGAAFAPLVFGVLLLPWAGSTFSMLLIAGVYLLLSSRRAWTSPAQWSMTAAVVALAIWAPSLALVKLPPGGRLVSYVEGAAASVSIVKDGNGVATLRINNRQQEGSSATLLADGRQGLLPVLLHPSPTRVLFLGLGTGVTARSAAEDPSLRVDAVELLPDVIAASRYFAAPFGESENPRLRILAADARRFVRVAPDLYDVIVADNFHPARSGSGSLYTVEHFAAVRERLGAGGLFCQWLPLHQLDLDTLRSIVRSYLAVYPQGWAMLATNSLDTPVLGLVSRRDGEHIEVDAVRRRLASVNTPRPIADFGITDDLALLGSFVAGPGGLDKFANTSPLNTDDRPIVTYRAPRVTYAPVSAPRDRLLELLGQLDVSPDEVLAGNRDAIWERRLHAYWHARDRFIASGRDVRPTFDVHAMLAQVQDPLLSVLRISPDFRPAYDPLLRMAYGVAASDVPAARALFSQLSLLQPARPEAAEALHDLLTSP